MLLKFRNEAHVLFNTCSFTTIGIITKQSLIFNVEIWIKYTSNTKTYDRYIVRRVWINSGEKYSLYAYLLVVAILRNIAP